MKTKIFYSLILVLGITFAGVSINSASAQTTKKTVEKTVKTTTKHVQHAVKYTCPMHPEVVMNNKAAKCPKCGMALVEKKENVKKVVKKEMNHMKVTKDSVKTTHSKMMKETQVK